VLDDDYTGAATQLGVALQARPRDVLALAMACGFDYVTGEAVRLRARVAGGLSAWPSDLQGYSSVLAMHAFGLAECGDAARAEEAATTALALDEDDARAHHAMAHVFELTERADDGVRWMERHAQHWATGTVVATHGWWHLALFHLARGDTAPALALHGRRIRGAGLQELSDLIDASALLWRLRLLDVDARARWSELAAAWSPYLEDGFRSFSDVHAMLALVGDHDEARAQRLEQRLLHAQSLPTRHGESTRQLGLPACRAVRAFGRGDHPLAIGLLGALPERVHRLGGSHAQRDVLHLTLLRAVEAIRRPGRRGVRPPATHETRPAAARHATAIAAA